MSAAVGSAAVAESAQLHTGIGAESQDAFATVRDRLPAGRPLLLLATGDWRSREDTPSEESDAAFLLTARRAG